MPRKKYNIICFGEILWDILPGGASPGGAPVNVAYHLKKLGQDPGIITRIGRDRPGEELMELLEGHGISTELIQKDATYPTGVARATATSTYGPGLGLGPGSSEDQNMRYEIVQPVAWDFIEGELRHQAELDAAGYFIFGSLAARSKGSGATLFSLTEAAHKKVVDINLRPPHYTKKLVLELIAKADILKLNEEELVIITDWLSDSVNINDRLDRLQEQFKIRTIIVTRGAQGALLKQNGAVFSHPGFPVDVVDTVGSGDALLAAFLTKTIEGCSPDEALAYGCALGAMVASQKGGWADYDLTDLENMIH